MSFTVSSSIDLFNVQRRNSMREDEVMTSIGLISLLPGPEGEGEEALGTTASDRGSISATPISERSGELSPENPSNEKLLSSSVLCLEEETSKCIPIGSNPEP